MNDKFLFGVILGMLGGAVLVANSTKVRTAIQDSQEQIKDKAIDMMTSKKKKSQK